MGEMLIFDYMFKDQVCSHIEVDIKAKSVKCEDFTSVKWHTVFGLRPHTIEYLNAFLESRCFPRGRADEKDILEYLGLTQYNPLDIVRKTHGVLHGSFSWIRFEGETLAWKDLDPREK